MGKKQSRKAPPEDANSGNPSSGAVGRRKKGGGMEGKKLKLVGLLAGLIVVLVGVGLYYGEIQEVKKEKEEVLREGVITKDRVGEIRFVDGSIQKHHKETSKKYMRTGRVFGVSYLGDYEVGDDYVEFVGDYQGKSLKIKVKVGPMYYERIKDSGESVLLRNEEDFLRLILGEYRVQVMYVPEEYKTDNESERDWCSGKSGRVVYCEWVKGGFGNERIEFLSYMRNEAEKGGIVIEGEKMVTVKLEEVE